MALRCLPPQCWEACPQGVGLEWSRWSQPLWEVGRGPSAGTPLTPPPRYISLLPVIPVTLRLNPREALEGRHPQDGRSAWRPRQPGPGGLWEAGPRAPGVAPAHGDVTLYK